MLVAEHLVRARVARVLPKGMELSHFAVLDYLAQSKEERTPADLARAFHLTRGAMTNTLAKLEWAGHVHIRPDWDDARRKRVAISSSGRAARDSALAALRPVLTGAVRGIGADKVRAALPVLREVRARFGEVPPKD
ncbi:MarR family transcriptional regulator [Jannaschia sp. Os4]|uniref:MarR family winged helix-turn-helix transcriptional regulator n=1 Tax=Jannaschia sp. Os4 TaxID=2807617 RepID=UPI001939E4B3|nr:MarR family transcriptional regulator [Jannaschia sp. Os4]MBM2575192.1 MarR family transcriptional regulator [Jannaschia sp. Os4]